MPKNVRSDLGDAEAATGYGDARARLAALIRGPNSSMQITTLGSPSPGGYADTPGWRAFQNESARITGEFAAAETAWQATLAELQSALGGVTTPDRPVV